MPRLLGAERRDALDTMRARYEPIIEQTFPTQADPRPRVAVPFVPRRPLGCYWQRPGV